MYPISSIVIQRGPIFLNGVLPYHLFRFVLFRFDLFRFVSICFVSFRFVSFRFDVSFRCFVPFRFVSVSFRTLQGPHTCFDFKIFT